MFIVTEYAALTFFILIDYPIHIETVSMELSILYFKGLTFKIFYKMMYFCPYRLFYVYQTVQTQMKCHKDPDKEFLWA